MIKHTLKKLDNIRNNILHSLDNLTMENYSQETTNSIKAKQNGVLEKMTEFRAEINKLLKTEKDK